MFAVIKTGGKQYIATPGAQLKIEKLSNDSGQPVPEGEEIVFDRVLLFSNKDTIEVGAPTVKNTRVVAEVLTHGRHKKVMTMKYKAKKRYKKKKGHKQYYTEVQIKDIQTAAPQKKKAPKKEEE